MSSQIINNNQAEEQQRHLAQKIAELEMDLDEHQVVLDALRSLSPDTAAQRRCHRLIGGVLVEQPVATVIARLEANCEEV